MITTEQRLNICGVCKNRSFNPKQGIICGLTKETPHFDENCDSFLDDFRAQKMEDTKTEHLNNQTKKTINKGRFALFAIGAIYLFVGIWEGFYINGHDIIYGIVDWVVAAIFIFLGVLSFRKASLSFIIGLSVYVLLIVLMAIIEPSTLISGIIWKIIIISSLALGIKQAREVEIEINPKSDELLDDF